MPRTLIAVNEQGRVTLPAEVRRRLGIRAGSQLEVKVEANGIRLRPATVIPEEDLWAYTRQAIASLKRGLADLKAGRVYQLTEAELLSGKLPRQPSRRRR